MTVKIKEDRIPRKYKGRRTDGSIHIGSSYIPFGDLFEVLLPLVRKYNQREVAEMVTYYFSLLYRSQRRKELQGNNLIEFNWKLI